MAQTESAKIKTASIYIYPGGSTDNSVTDIVEVWNMDVNDIDGQSLLTAGSYEWRLWI